MARPQGLILSKRTFDDLLIIRRTTRTAVAQHSGVSPQQLGDMYGAKRAGASMRTAVALAEALDVSVETLFPEAEGFGRPSKRVEVAA